MGDRLPSGADIEIFESLDSTSLEAKRRAADGAAGPQWIVALRQTAGYGRRGSAWRQEAGDVAATLLFRPNAPAEALPQLSFVAALAAADAIQRFAPKAPLSLKWPNDVLAGDGKIAGLLLELVTKAGSAPLVALGVGVNILSAPTGLEYRAARLIDFAAGAPPHPRAFVEALDETFDAWRRQWERDGFAEIRAEWLRRAANVGRRVRIQLAGEVAEGVFADLDPAGALVLDCDGERRLIAAGAMLPADNEGRRG